MTTQEDFRNHLDRRDARLRRLLRASNRETNVRRRIAALVNKEEKAVIPTERWDEIEGLLKRLKKCETRRKHESKRYGAAEHQVRQDLAQLKSRGAMKESLKRSIAVHLEAAEKGNAPRPKQGMRKIHYYTDRFPDISAKGPRRYAQSALRAHEVARASDLSQIVTLRWLEVGSILNAYAHSGHKAVHELLPDDPARAAPRDKLRAFARSQPPPGWSWFTDRGTPLQRLGMDDDGRRPLARHRAMQRLCMLESTTAPIQDIWSLQGLKKHKGLLPGREAAGGGVQRYIAPCQRRHLRLIGLKRRMTPERRIADKVRRRRMKM